MSLGVIVSLCSFHRKILVIFPVGPMTSLVLELIYSIRNGTPFHGVALSSIRKWLGGWVVGWFGGWMVGWLVGYFHNISTTLHKRDNFSLDL